MASGFRTASRTRSRYRFLVLSRERPRRADALSHENVRLAETIGVGDHSHDDEAELFPGELLHYSIRASSLGLPNGRGLKSLP